MADERKMGFQATWSMAVGGMVGGGIFSVLGVVVGLAGVWAVLSFVLAGLVALATGHSYAALARKFGEGGGAFTFLREERLTDFAGSLSWILVIGYVLTVSVYAFTFGHYLAAVVDLGPWMPRAAAAFVVASLVAVNLKGVGEASWLEVFTVWGKLLVLLGLAAFGLATLHPDRLAFEGADPGGFAGALVGAASIFMAYEGFQLLTYDYEDIREPRRTLPRAIVSAILAVILIYVLVTLGASSLVGAKRIVAEREIALAVAGEAALGLTGKILVTVAAAFSTASAINATLFATARLTRTVAQDGELPRWFAHENAAGIPDRAVIVLGVAGGTLAMVGSLTQLVEAASLAFLFTFATVNVLAARECERYRFVGWLGAGGAATAGAALAIRLGFEEPVSLVVLAALAAAAVFLRPLLSSR